MLYRAKSNKDEGVKGCKVIGNGNIYGYELVNTFFVDNSGFGADDEPALTFDKFLEKVKAGFYYGIRECGQFQVYIGEYKKITIDKKAQGILSSKKISKSCRKTEYINGDLSIILYSTEILKKVDNKYILNSGGYKTVTTKNRINEFLPQGIRVYQKKYQWYVDNNGKHIEFTDGITI